LEKKLKPYLLDKGISNAVQVSTEDGKLTIRLAAGRFFDAGLAELRPEMIPVLDSIAEELRPIDNPVHVEGHADQGAVVGNRFRNNWDLSAARAVSVVTYIERVHRFESTRLSAVGYGSTRPLNTRDTPEGREENRRIELVLELGLSDGRGLPLQ
jgi:chemotaxis protein MotB